MVGACFAKHYYNMYEQPTQPASETLEVVLDGRPIKLPTERRSINSIRTYLETLALENERVLCTFHVDGRPAKITRLHPCPEKTSFTRVEGRTVSLTDMPLRMLETALQETAQARVMVETAVTTVLINDGAVARELWWGLARKLKEPLLTLSLLPETIYQPVAGCVSLLQLRKWQLQQLAIIIRAVDEACWSATTDALSNALENRALPWLDKLQQMIILWHQTVLAGSRLRTNDNRDIDQRSLANS